MQFITSLTVITFSLIFLPLVTHVFVNLIFQKPKQCVLASKLIFFLNCHKDFFLSTCLMYALTLQRHGHP